ncbi:MAG: hypothetical protein JWM60_117 [Solirubrobacterales bacterium]|nr:hypothetical protein [Solirubrobacterales bacterium]
MQEETPEEREQAEQAAREAAQIGGTASVPGGDPAGRPVREAGGGEAEGFEQAEELLIEHASHGDEQPAHFVLHHQGVEEEPDPARADGEADHEHSSEREDEETSPG